MRAPDGYDACRSGVLVKIVHAGSVVDKVETGPNGRFRAELPDEHGRYRAVAPRLDADDANVCERARSRTRRI